MKHKKRFAGQFFMNFLIVWFFLFAMLETSHCSWKYFTIQKLIWGALTKAKYISWNKGTVPDLNFQMQSNFNFMQDFLLSIFYSIFVRKKVSENVLHSMICHFESIWKFGKPFENSGRKKCEKLCQKIVSFLCSILFEVACAFWKMCIWYSMTLKCTFKSPASAFDKTLSNQIDLHFNE